MARLNIVLFEPQIPQNTGNISRTCAVTGAALHLIEPLGFEITDAKLKRAGLDYWDKLEVHRHRSWQDFEAACTGELWLFTTTGSVPHSEVSYSSTEDVYLVFGREDRGLPVEVLSKYRHRRIRIPMRAGVRCLNLSNSAAIGVYEVLRQWDYPELWRDGRLPEEHRR